MTRRVIARSPKATVAISAGIASVASLPRNDRGCASSSRFAGLLAMAVLCLQAAAWARPPQELNFPPLQFSPPAIQRTVLKSGATVFLLPDKELPLINLTAYVRTGSAYEPADKAGVANFTAALLRGGGTRFRSREALDQELEFMGASVETGMDVESGNASLSCLKKDFEATLKIFAEVLRYPAFSADKLEIEKAKSVESIRRRNDEPFQIARREFRRTIYGPTHPLSRTPEIPAVRKISRADLTAFYGNFYKPRNITIAVSGDFEPASMIQSLEGAFAGWESPPTVWPKVETVSSKASSGACCDAVYAEKDLTQSSVILGHLGIKRHNPDRFSLEVMNEILGGGVFSSRLSKEIRARRGLAYWVGSNFTEPWDYGTIAAACQTKSQSLGQTVKGILAEIERIRREEVSEEELKLAKDAIINSFVFRYDSPHAIVSQRMSLEYFGYPPDYLQTYTAKIAKVTAKDVLAAAQKYIHPERLNLIVVGNEKDFDVKLSSFGRVTKADLAIKE